MFTEKHTDGWAWRCYWMCGFSFVFFSVEQSAKLDILYQVFTNKYQIENNVIDVFVLTE